MEHLAMGGFDLIFSVVIAANRKRSEKNPFPGIQTFLYSDTKILLYGKTWSIAAWRYCNGK